MLELQQIQKAISEEKLDGWLFCTVYNRDPLFQTILGVKKDFRPSRVCAYFIPVSGTPVKINSLVEPNILDHLPGEKKLYNGREKLDEIFCHIPRGHYAVQISPTIPFLAGMEASTATFLRKLGWELVPSDVLVQKTSGLLNEQQQESHQRAAVKLYEVVQEVWQKLTDVYKKNPVWEQDVQNWILQAFSDKNMVTDHPPIVCFGANSSIPHYAPEGRGARLEDNQVIQLDLWAKESDEAAIFADISWLGFSGTTIPDEVEEVFKCVTDARNEAVNFIHRCLRTRRLLTGAMIDQDVRRFIDEKSNLKYVKHRTGHSIDRDVHGIGVNLDCFEFADMRPVINGCCFSVEPGIYTEQFGMRTEINVIISNNLPLVTGGQPQQKILHF